MGKRAQFAMVAEDDPQWVRFWTAFPSRVAKKDARKAWAALHPDVALVDQMMTALTWQTALWTQQGYGTPYPATYLRGARWTDEPPPAASAKPKQWTWRPSEAS